MPNESQITSPVVKAATALGAGAGSSATAAAAKAADFLPADLAGWMALAASTAAVLYMLHRLAWLYVAGKWPDGVIDHIDGDKGNNRFANLRDVTVSVNGQNQKRAMPHNGCGFLGVTFAKKVQRYRANINIDGRGRSLGYFDTPEEAHAVYLQEKRRHHAGCTI